MPAVSSSVTINQPVEKVFNYVVDVANHKAWQAGVLDARVTPAGPIGVGTTYHYTSEVMGHRMETQMQVSAFEANKKWSVRTLGANSVETAYVFEPAGSGTKLTLSMELGGGYPKMAEGMVMQQMEKSLVEQGERIKKAVGG
jgi:uncharacterized protein YndB with AHSA1/START domain